jgi:hypothetical protein
MKWRLTLNHRKIAALAALSMTLFATMPALAQQPATTPRTINLPVEMKDPYTAYAIGLVPFYSTAAATYVGTSRLSWDPPANLKNAGTNQFLADLSFVAAGLLLAGVAGATNNPAVGMASIATFAIVPVSHSLFYAPYWGDRAVEFNRTKMRDAGFFEEARGRH